ncbi:RICIN domain-containing protein [Spirosoma sp. BT702]|uniref:RICIN domain-containing protein n=2 Tax=Spirosoma profusum TaxID=2771354 RepID=A0A927AUC2_9BACT|nr:RICIN domain-containing protein [Spirosoma profusum]
MVRMSVGDNKGGYSGFQTISVSVTNPPPTAKITTPVNLSKYALNMTTSYTLAATVTDDVPDRVNYLWQGKLRINGKDQYPTYMTGTNPVFTVSPVGCDGIDDYYYVFTLKVTDIGNLTAQDSVKIYPDCNSPKLNVTGLTATTLTSSSVRLIWTNPTIPFDKVLVVGKPGSTILGYIPDPNSVISTVSSSFTANPATYPADAARVLYLGTGNSVVVTDLTPGQLYYFRVSAHSDGWSGGVEVNTKSSTVNRPPVVVATSTSLTGTSPLSVTFTGDKSSDPDGDQLFYEWAFSDGTYLNVANPVKVFTTQTGQHGSGTINNFTAQLTVTDSKGQRSTSQVFNISLNSTSGSVLTVEPDKCYRLVSRVSGKVLGVEGGSLEDGALVRQRTDANQQSQRWRFEATNNGYYKIGAVHSNKVIDVLWGSQQNGAALQQWTFNGNWSYNQHFALLRNTSGYFQIAARHSGKALEVQNGNSDEGGLVVQNTPNGGNNQQWLIEERACTTITSPPSSTTTAPPPTSVVSIDPAKCYRIQSRSSGLVLNVPNGSYDDGANLRQNANVDQAWQKWRLIPTDGGYYKMVVLHNQKGIQAPSFSTADDVLLEQWTYWGGSHQQWAVQRNAEGFYTFSNRNSNKAITVRNASTTDGAAIIQQTLGTGQNQQWSVSETTCPAGARSGVEEVIATFGMWPNPASDHVLIDLRPALGQPVGLQLNDLSGRPLQRTHLEAAPAEPYRFGLGQLPDGLYLMQIKPAGQAATTLRVLIQR